MMEMQSQFREQMPAEERAKWDKMNGLKGKAAFAKLVEMNKEEMTKRFKGDFKVLKVDTLVVMTVQHEGQTPDIMLMKWENGGYRMTQMPSPPTPPSEQMPQGHPDVQGAPQGAPPQAPPSPSHGQPTPPADAKQPAK
jgi:hypothetical protein